MMGCGGLGRCFLYLEEHDDYEVLFMHPHGPSRHIKWPQQQDICWVPQAHMLCSVTAVSYTHLTLPTNREV